MSESSYDEDRSGVPSTKPSFGPSYGNLGVNIVDNSDHINTDPVIPRLWKPGITGSQPKPINHENSETTKTENLKLIYHNCFSWFR